MWRSHMQHDHLSYKYFDSIDLNLSFSFVIYRFWFANFSTRHFLLPIFLIYITFSTYSFEKQLLKLGNLWTLMSVCWSFLGRENAERRSPGPSNRSCRRQGRKDKIHCWECYKGDWGWTILIQLIIIQLVLIHKYTNAKWAPLGIKDDVAMYFIQM